MADSVIVVFGTWGAVIFASTQTSVQSVVVAALGTVVLSSLVESGVGGALAVYGTRCDAAARCCRRRGLLVAMGFICGLFGEANGDETKRQGGCGGDGLPVGGLVCGEGVAVI